MDGSGQTHVKFEHDKTFHWLKFNEIFKKRNMLHHMHFVSFDEIHWNL